jgi:hypothetical protein
MSNEKYYDPLGRYIPPGAEELAKKTAEYDAANPRITAGDIGMGVGALAAGALGWKGAKTLSKAAETTSFGKTAANTIDDIKGSVPDIGKRADAMRKHERDMQGSQIFKNLQDPTWEKNLYDNLSKQQIIQSDGSMVNLLDDNLKAGLGEMIKDLRRARNSHNADTSLLHADDLANVSAYLTNRSGTAATEADELLLSLFMNKIKQNKNMPADTSLALSDMGKFAESVYYSPFRNDITFAA